MDFSNPKPRRQSEPALPMINVVFLLLIFFLMSAQITVPPPLDITPPSASTTDTTVDDLRLHLDAEGTLALDLLREDAVWAKLSTVEAPGQKALLIRADAGLDAKRLAEVLARLSTLGFSSIQLATVPK